MFRNKKKCQKTGHTSKRYPDKISLLETFFFFSWGRKKNFTAVSLGTRGLLIKAKLQSQQNTGTASIVQCPPNAARVNSWFSRPKYQDNFTLLPCYQCHKWDNNSWVLYRMLAGTLTGNSGRFVAKFSEVESMIKPIQTEAKFTRLH